MVLRPAARDCEASFAGSSYIRSTELLRTAIPDALEVFRYSFEAESSGIST